MRQYSRRLVVDRWYREYHNSFDSKKIWTDTYDGPDNRVVLLSHNVSMRCRNSSQSGGKVISNGDVIWMFKASGLNNEEITVYTHSGLHHNPAGRWSVNKSGGTNELIITDAKPEDAGRYDCITSIEEFTAQLVVLGKSEYDANYRYNKIWKIFNPHRILKKTYIRLKVKGNDPKTKISVICFLLKAYSLNLQDDRKNHAQIQWAKIIIEKLLHVMS